jgi:hypothetical protein
MIVFNVYNRLPPLVRYRLKKLFRTAGHSASWFDGLIARRDACGKKALAQSLEHTLRLLDIAGIRSLRGMKTMDFGCGYVPTDAVAHWLLGAEQSYAVDYNAIGNFDALKLALAGDNERKLARLVPASLQTQFFARLRALRQLDVLSPATLATAGIHYLAPFDVLRDKPPVAFDLILSTSVLEHIATRDIARVLTALGNMLVEHGKMVHEIHLEDHLDINRDPFNFLRQGTTYRQGEDHDARGNRVSRKDWRRYFTLLECCASIEAEARFTPKGRVPAPAVLLPEYYGQDDEELFASHLVYVSQKRRA